MVTKHITLRCIGLLLVTLSACGGAPEQVRIREEAHLILHHPRRMVADRSGDYTYFISGDVMLGVERHSGNIVHRLDLGALAVSELRSQAYPQLTDAVELTLPNGIRGFRVSPYSQLSLDADGTLHLLGDITVPTRSSASSIDLFYYPIHLQLSGQLEVLSVHGFSFVGEQKEHFISSVFGGFFYADKGYTNINTEDNQACSVLLEHQITDSLFSPKRGSEVVPGRALSFDRIDENKVITGREGGVLSIHNFSTGSSITASIQDQRIMEVKWIDQSVWVIHKSHAGNQVQLSRFNHELMHQKTTELSHVTQLNQEIMTAAFSTQGALDLLLLDADENYWLQRIALHDLIITDHPTVQWPHD